MADMADIKGQVGEAMRAEGIEPPERIEIDSKMHRFATDPRKSGDDAGWYKFHADFPQAGAFGDFRAGTSFTWSVDSKAAGLSKGEIDELNRKIKADKREARKVQEAQWAEAARKAAEVWRAAEDADRHEYAEKKGVDTAGARIFKSALVLPVFAEGKDGQDYIQSIQRIGADGEKRFMKGAKTGGGFLTVGEDDGGVVYLAEGWATAKSIVSQLGGICYVCFSSGNMPSVAKIVGRRHSGRDFVIFADNDEQGTGEKYAHEAAEKIGGRVVVPPEVGQDANDYVQAGGSLKELVDGSPELPSVKVGNSGQVASQDLAMVIKDYAVKVFRVDGQGRVYAQIPDGDFLPAGGKRFQDYVSNFAYSNFDILLTPDKKKEVAGMLETYGTMKAVKGKPFGRYGEVDTADGKVVYVNLCRRDRKGVKITAYGWKIVSDFHHIFSDLPVFPVPTEGSDEMPLPMEGADVFDGLGAIQALLPGLHGDDFLLLLSWMVQSMRQMGPFPIAVIRGGQGAGKSFASKILKKIIDPSSVEIIPAPEDQDDLITAVQAAHLLPFDNVSRIGGKMSDLICQVSTGLNSITRKLYTNDDAHMVAGVYRPMILNGIGDFLTRGDALERSVNFELESIEPEMRRSEKALYALLRENYPLILGALYSVAAGTMQEEERLGDVFEPLRMADFCRIGRAACAAAGADAEIFMTIYRANQKEAQEVSVESNPISGVLLQFAKNRTRYVAGNIVEYGPTELFEALKQEDGWDGHSKYFPQTVNQLSRQLTRMQSGLYAEGFSLKKKRTGGDRKWIIADLKPAEREYDDDQPEFGG